MKSLKDRKLSQAKYRELVIGGGGSGSGGNGGGVPFFATQSQNTERATPRAKKDRYHGFLFAPGFNDRILLREGQLDRWVNYLHDNPRRLLMKREHPDLFRVQRGLTIGTQQFSAIGNRFLLDRPVKIQVQCSRRLTVEQAPAPHYPTRKRLHRPRQTWRSAHGGLRSWSTALTGPMAASQ